ncbi:UDP-D-galactose:(glucosyl)lipopolysaccharide-1, 6-D-galactosyltransferase [Saccharicrinis fermentans DSM 9555 = JCM 21142]|uniref:UDP-D-galactose:(Glucosyl)lipopolysaccharide-1, 6-D-galactosyltransferase n=1 Tax=Saccharicrinis fermentans DSM 9555 = JCM 21142 TaxID=869213 RepID=W7YFK7_9BACT|nr:UDP-D-galactose:(glucosyl)lipopolysaccharide-1, 6-D-galactosyltransferase [Saccharicrinis fermentans DSM 9555 = JCM 21142]
MYALFCKKYDLVHLHHTDGAFILPLLKLRYKVVVTSHARPQEHVKWNWWVNYFFTLNEKIAFKMADQFTAVSKPLKEVYDQVYQREVVFIPNGVDIRTAIGKDDSVSDEEPYILFAAGRIIPSKGLHILLRTLQAMDFKTKIKVVGNLEQIPAYKRQILSLSEGLNVEFVGLFKNKVALLNLVANAQLFVYPTLYEAMSIMLLEAASVKVPIICSDIPANTAVFSNEEVSLFVSEDMDDLQHKILYFYGHKSEAFHKAQKAFEKLEKSHSWATIANQYKVVFASLM